MAEPSPSAPPSSPPSGDGEGPSEKQRLRGRLAALAAALLSGLAVVVPLVAIPAMFLTFFAFVVQRRPRAGTKVLLGLATCLVLFAMVRFTVTEAAPGIVEGGKRAQAKSALNQLRAIVFGQDIAREQGFLDPDGDGIGSALSLSALVGQPMRNGAKPPLPILARFGPVEVAKGRAIAAFQGYGFIVYLPTADGQAAAMGTPDVDDELAERRFVAYGWPLDGGHGEQTVVFIDEHERILISDNLGAQQGYIGLDKPPPFYAALMSKRIDAAAASEGVPGADGGTWAAWKGKKARAQLPGDKASSR